MACHRYFGILLISVDIVLVRWTHDGMVGNMVLLHVDSKEVVTVVKKEITQNNRCGIPGGRCSEPNILAVCGKRSWAM